jgi:hypothetical protein
MDHGPAGFLTWPTHFRAMRKRKNPGQEVKVLTEVFENAEEGTTMSWWRQEPPQS